MLGYSNCQSVLSIMSKVNKQNRNIQSSSFSHINVSKFPPIDRCFHSKETSSNKKYILGEPVEKECSYTFQKSNWLSNKIARVNNDIDIESVNSGVSEIKLIKRLSSSPSWSDDNDASKQVQDELEHMDRILREIDPLPLHYDVDEYKQWMQTFPSLSLFGQKGYELYEIWKNGSECNSSYNIADKEKKAFTKSNEMKNYKEEIKKAVIYTIYETLSVRNSSETPLTSTSELKESRYVGNLSRTQSYLKYCLKNSPFTRIVQERYKRNCFYSILEDAVKISPRFESLPLMFKGSSRNHSSTKNENNSFSSSCMRKSERSIILPPIAKNRLYSTKQIKSFSATPIHSSLLSAKSIKMEGKMFNNKSRNVH